MSERLIIDGNAVYEIDEDCMRQQEARKQMGRPRRGMGERQPCRECGAETTKQT